MGERFLVLRIIWLAMTAGVATFTAVAVGLVLFGVMEAGLLPSSVLPMVAAAAAVMMGVGALLRRRLVESIPRGASAEERLVKYQAAVIPALALIDGAGLLLVVVGLVAAAPGYILAGGIAAVLVMALARPTRDEAGLAGPAR